jgi:transcriptional regulator with XRE-family HTH domain
MPPTRRAPTPAQIDQAFGRVLRELREATGISQEWLAHESQSGRTFISELERGTKGASIKTLFRLAAVLDTSPSNVLRRVEQQLSSRADR